MRTCGDLGDGTLEAQIYVGKDQKQHLDLIDWGSRLSSAAIWLCYLEQVMGLSGLLFLHSVQRKKRLPYVKFPGTLWVLIKH